MVFQPVTGACQVTMEFRDISTGLFVGQNTLCFEHTNATNWTQAELIDLVNRIGTWWNEDLRGTVSNDVRYQRVYARGLNSDQSAYWEATPAAAGTYSSIRVPANVTLAVAFRSAFTGRNARGRAFMCGLPQIVITEDKVSDVYGNLLIGAWEELSNNMPAGTRHVIVSRFSGGQQMPGGITYPVTAYALTDTRVDTRRTRLRR